nr:hypothetical protein [Caulobacter vibrioides]
MPNQRDRPHPRGDVIVGDRHDPTPERHWDYTQSIGVMRQIAPTQNQAAAIARQGRA